jgi:hypothetical protein
MRVALRVSVITGLLALATPGLLVPPSSAVSSTTTIAQPWTLNAAPIHIVVCDMTAMNPAVCTR